MISLIFIYRSNDTPNSNQQEEKVSILSRIKESAGNLRDRVTENRIIASLRSGSGNGDLSSGTTNNQKYSSSHFSSHISSLLSSTRTEDVTGEDVLVGVEEIRERKRERVEEFHDFKLTREGLIQNLENIKSVEKQLLGLIRALNLGQTIENQLDTELRLTKSLLEMARSFRSSGMMMNALR